MNLLPQMLHSDAYEEVPFLVTPEHCEKANGYSQHSPHRGSPRVLRPARPHAQKPPYHPRQRGSCEVGDARHVPRNDLENTDENTAPPADWQYQYSVFSINQYFPPKILIGKNTENYCTPDNTAVLSVVFSIFFSTSYLGTQVVPGR